MWSSKMKIFRFVRVVFSFAPVVAVLLVGLIGPVEASGWFLNLNWCGTGGRGSGDTPNGHGIFDAAVPAPSCTEDRIEVYSRDGRALLLRMRWDVEYTTLADVESALRANYGLAHGKKKNWVVLREPVPEVLRGGGMAEGPTSSSSTSSSEYDYGLTPAEKPEEVKHLRYMQNGAAAPALAARGCRNEQRLQTFMYWLARRQQQEGGGLRADDPSEDQVRAAPYPYQRQNAELSQSWVDNDEDPSAAPYPAESSGVLLHAQLRATTGSGASASAGVQGGARSVRSGQQMNFAPTSGGVSTTRDHEEPATPPGATSSSGPASMENPTLSGMILAPLSARLRDLNLLADVPVEPRLCDLWAGPSKVIRLYAGAARSGFRVRLKDLFAFADTRGIPKWDILPEKDATEAGSVGFHFSMQRPGLQLCGAERPKNGSSEGTVLVQQGGRGGGSASGHIMRSTFERACDSTWLGTDEGELHDYPQLLNFVDRVRGWVTEPLVASHARKRSEPEVELQRARLHLFGQAAPAEDHDHQGKEIEAGHAETTDADEGSSSSAADPESEVEDFRPLGAFLQENFPAIARGSFQVADAAQAEGDLFSDSPPVNSNPQSPGRRRGRSVAASMRSKRILPDREVGTLLDVVHFRPNRAEIAVKVQPASRSRGSERHSPASGGGGGRPPVATSSSAGGSPAEDADEERRLANKRKRPPSPFRALSFDDLPEGPHDGEITTGQNTAGRAPLEPIEGDARLKCHFLARRGWGPSVEAVPEVLVRDAGNAQTAAAGSGGRKPLLSNELVVQVKLSVIDGLYSSHPPHQRPPSVPAETHACPNPTQLAGRGMTSVPAQARGDQDDHEISPSVRSLLEFAVEYRVKEATAPPSDEEFDEGLHPLELVPTGFAMKLHALYEPPEFEKVKGLETASGRALFGGSAASSGVEPAVLKDARGRPLLPGEVLYRARFVSEDTDVREEEMGKCGGDQRAAAPCA